MPILRTTAVWRAPILMLGLLLGLAGCAAQRSGLTDAQIGVLQAQGFKPVNGEWQLGINDRILFGLNEAVLTPETTITVQHIGQALTSVAIDHLRVDGYTDDYGTDSYNDDLSLRRAQAVAAVLRQTGIPRIEASGFGKQAPIGDNGTAAGRSENRRVAIIVPPDQ
jgi:outer membrane protein OmpA-like peptidoglycan-associated protein